MSETNVFITHEPLPFIFDEAREMGLCLPKIEIAERLGVRLARYSAALAINDIALLNGTKQAEVEDPVTIKIDSIPKDSKSRKTALTFDGDSYEGNARAHMQICSQPEWSAKSIRQINASFWLGVLVSEAVAEGHTQYPKHPGIPSSKASYIGVGVTAGITNAVSIAIEKVGHLNIPATGDFWGNVTLGTVAGLGFGSAYSRHFRAKVTSIHKLQKSHLKEADELANEFQVVSYTAK